MLPVAEVRRVLETVQAAVPVDLSGVVESEKTIVSEGHTLCLNLVRPARTGHGRLPAFVFIHGGGWVLGDFPTHRRLVRDLVVESGCATVFVNYTPSPEARFPKAVEEIYAAVRFLTVPLMNWMFGQHISDPAQRDNDLLSPVRASEDRLWGLPPTLIAVAENDMLRDEAEAMGRCLDQAGVEVTTVRFNGVIHDWGMLNGFAGLHPTKMLIRLAGSVLRDALK